MLPFSDQINSFSQAMHWNLHIHPVRIKVNYSPLIHKYDVEIVQLSGVTGFLTCDSPYQIFRTVLAGVRIHSPP
jgi:hypothetical protein